MSAVIWLTIEIALIDVLMILCCRETSFEISLSVEPELCSSRISRIAVPTCESRELFLFSVLRLLSPFYFFVKVFFWLKKYKAEILLLRRHKYLQTVFLKNTWDRSDAKMNSSFPQILRTVWIRRSKLLDLEQQDCFTFALKFHQNFNHEALKRLQGF